MATFSALGKCPACGEQMEVHRLACPGCGTAVEGRFQGCPFCSLTAGEQEFVLLFLRCRGNIREVERELKVSYPTVRSRLDDVVGALGFDPSPGGSGNVEDRHRDILRSLEDGEISAREAARLLTRTRG